MSDFLKSAATTARLDSGKGDYIAEVKDSYSFMVRLRSVLKRQMESQRQHSPCPIRRSIQRDSSLRLA